MSLVLHSGIKSWYLAEEASRLSAFSALPGVIGRAFHLSILNYILHSLGVDALCTHHSLRITPRVLLPHSRIDMTGYPTHVLIWQVTPLTYWYDRLPHSFPPSRVPVFHETMKFCLVCISSPGLQPLENPFELSLVLTLLVWGSWQLQHVCTKA